MNDIIKNKFPQIEDLSLSEAREVSQIFKKWLMEEPNYLKGSTKVAIAIGNIPPDFSRYVVQYLTKTEKEIIVREISQLSSVETELIEKILTEMFALLNKPIISIIEEVSNVEESVEDIITEETVTETITEEKAEETVIEEKAAEPFEEEADVVLPFKDFDMVSDEKILYRVIKGEDIRSISIFLYYLKPLQSSKILNLFSEDKMTEIVHYLSELDYINKNELELLEENLLQKLEFFMNDGFNVEGKKAIERIAEHTNGKLNRIIKKYS